MDFKKLSLFILLLSVLSFTAFADTGSRDMLTVYIENPPDELYYLTLLTKERIVYNDLDPRSRELAELAPEITRLLNSLAVEGWQPALTRGRVIPMQGHAVRMLDSERLVQVHQFSYYGLPKTYRIIIAAESGKVTVSDVLTRKAPQSNVTFDYATGAAAAPSVFIAYLLQFLAAFSAAFLLTIFVEGIILLLFRFKLRANWKVFLSVNFITQVFLTFTVGITLIKSGRMNAYHVLFPVELVILVAETLVYKRFLTGAGDRRRAWYGLTANLASWFGIVYISFIFIF